MAMNTVEDAIAAFAAASNTPPEAALRWSLDHWDAAAPQFLAMLEAYADGTDDSEETEDALLFIVHLFGDRGDRRAYRPLCRLMLNEERLINVLGVHASVETLKGVLIKCFDGDTKPLRDVVEATGAHSITRGEAMLALAWLARDGKWPEDDLRDYLRFLLREMQPREADYVWYGWIMVIAVLGYKEFLGEAAKLITDGLVPEEWLTMAEFADLIEIGDPVGKQGLLSEEVEPFDDALAIFADWPWPDDFDDLDVEDAREPYINPLRHVGRNDPCPCGSGKKFKNCHLLAE